MYARILCAATSGIDGQLIEVEADVASGLPQVTIVGLPDSSIRESTERVRTAIRNCGFEFPLARVTVNLAPADLRKEGSSFDLAIAIGILVASGQIASTTLAAELYIGELSLDGMTKPVAGILSMVHAAKERGIRSIAVPADNEEEARLINGVNIVGVRSLTAAVKPDTAQENRAHSPSIATTHSDITLRDAPSADFSEVQGQMQAKRAITIAAAGMHNVLLIGPPGSGKTMLLRRLPSILPPLSDDEALEVMKIYSVSGLYIKGSGLWRDRPFRSPHHTISYAGILGGGPVPKPGEVSLAHRGVLFLDELPEFSRQVLEVLRQPLEDRFVTIARAKATIRYPTSFLLAGSMNPCPCGYSGVSSSVSARCVCSPLVINRYRNKLSGPLLDRIDLHMEVPAVDFGELTDAAGTNGALSSEAMRLAVEKAHRVQQERYRGMTIRFNSELSGSSLRRYCEVPNEAMQLLKQSFEFLGLSARALDRILKIGRTIADLEGAVHIETKHIAEAIHYRVLDRKSG